MTAHELARELLDGPDIEIVVRDTKDDGLCEPIVTGESGNESQLVISPYHP